jgi:hypothetical protein
MRGMLIYDNSLFPFRICMKIPHVSELTRKGIHVKLVAHKFRNSVEIGYMKDR